MNSPFWLSKSSDERRIFDRIVSALESIADSLNKQDRIAELEAELASEHEAYTALEKMYLQHRADVERLRSNTAQSCGVVAQSGDITTDKGANKGEGE